MNIYKDLCKSILKRIIFQIYIIILGIIMKMENVEGLISSGTKAIDNLIGGYEKSIISTVYGPAGSGKTNLAICFAISIIKQNKKVIYVDTEGGFSIERLKQLDPNYKEILEKIIFLKPTTFNEQKRAFDKLRTLVDENLGGVIIDSIAMLYRLELGQSEDVYETNRELGRQIAYLTELARKQNIPILVTNQVYSSFEEKNKINMVGGDILKYGSKCLIELKKDMEREALVKKHRFIPEGKSLKFKIKENEII